MNSTPNGAKTLESTPILDERGCTPLKYTPILDGYRRGRGAQGAPIAEIDVIADIARDREGKTNWVLRLRSGDRDIG